MKELLTYFEKQAFGVSAKLSEKLGIPTGIIRMFFIYLSFLTYGSPVIVYLCLAFTINVRKHLRRRRSPVWDL